MFRFFRNRKKNQPLANAETESESHDDEPVWYPANEENPFNQAILDIRRVTLNLSATTTRKLL